MDVELLTWRELVARAGSPAKARREIAEGQWWRVLRGLYAPVEHPDSPALRVSALARVLPDDVAVSHRTALWLLGIDVLGDHLDVTVPRGRHLERRPGIRTHAAALPDAELCEVGGLLVVSAHRAVVDVARSEPLIEAVAVADAALRSGAAVTSGVAESLERAAGLRGVRAARLILPHLEPRAESLMESRTRMRLVLGGLPRFEAQVDLYDDDGHAGRADLYLDGVAVEYDGVESRRRTFDTDGSRQNRICDLEVEVRRFTRADYYKRPAVAMCAAVQRALELAKRRDRSGVRRGPDTLPPPGLKPLATRADADDEAA